MKQWIAPFLFIGALFCAQSTPTSAQPIGFQISQPQPGVTVLSDDTGSWGGASMGTSHQNTEEYQTKKTLNIPAGALEGKTQARLRVFMALVDNSSANYNPHANGLDESFALIVNGHSHSTKDNEPFLRGSATPAQPLTWRWTDFEIPLSELREGENTFVFHKEHSAKNDDYLYIGIDNSVSFGHSEMSLDGGKSWTTQSLNTIKATGEYMVRLLLLKETPQSFAVWTLQKTTDPHHLIGYAGMEKNADASVLNLELDSFRSDPLQPFKAAVRIKDENSVVRWLDKNDKPIAVGSTFADGVRSATFAVGQNLAKIEIPTDKSGTLPASEVRFEYSQPVGIVAQSSRVNMAPRVFSAKGKPTARKPGVLLSANGFTIQNATQIAKFETKPKLRLVSLRNEYLQKNVLVHPEATHLFLTEIDDKRFGAEDWKVQSVKAISPTKVLVQLALPQAGLSAIFMVGVDAQKMNFGLKVTNTSQKTLSWKTAFPQIGGLQLSKSADDDSYLFPLWGGVIASQNVSLKTNYGDETAWWQMVDLFSPEGGAGVMLRNLDETGLYKGVVLRKGSSNIAGGSFAPGGDSAGMTPDQSWSGSLKAAPGTAMTFEFLKYTRPPGGSFVFPNSALEMHSGDWHSAMREYSQWAHRVWKWRPFPSKLHDVWNIDVAGWDQDVLYRDGKWRTDFVNDKSEVTELMSWWQWSKKGPWQVPIDQIEAKLGKAFYDRYKPYFAINPANGKLEYTINRGDYNYNADWGGLPALKKELQAIRDGGQVPMFYVDPILADDNTVLGHEYGPKYGVMNPSWKDGYNVPLNPPGYVAAYGGYNMCTDTEWYQNFVVAQATRIVHDTGVDGIRFDEFGHAGYTCFNPQHDHIFAEPGHESRLQSISRMCKSVHESVDKIKPDFILTSEFPGYDHLAANLEGSINYESTSHVVEAFRPVPLNIFRFYFPETKPYDLDYNRTPRGQEWRFWNASGAFEILHPPLYHRILQQNGDAFGSRQVTPLVPTLVEGIYANRFEGGGKTITLLYNASGFTIDVPLLAAPAKPGFHYFDLLSGQEIATKNNAIVLKLQQDKVAAVALLPKTFSVNKTANGWQVQLNRTIPDAAISVCDAAGAELSRQAVPKLGVLLKPPAAGNAVYVKLFSGKYLVDAQAVQ